MERLFVRLAEDESPGLESDAPLGTMRGGAVGAALDEYVSHLLIYREQLPADTTVIERVLPDGAVRLAFNLADAPSVGVGAGHQVEAIGACATPALVRMAGRIEGLSVTLRPGAASAVLGLPVGELTNSAVHLDELWRGEGTRLVERLRDAKSDQLRCALLEATLLGRLCDGQRHERQRAVHAARLLAASAGTLRVRAAAEAVGVGERRLQQLFHQHVGLSPRAFGRLQRLQALLRALRARPSARWGELAQQLGFYDQAHLTNEFRALSGLTPTAFLAHSVSRSSKTNP